MASSRTHQYRPLLASESRKRYNNTDSKEQLLLLEVSKERFGGYKRDLLINSLTEVEIEFYVCIACNGIMRNACHVGEEQTPVCEGCVREGVFPQSMMRSRKKIPQLVVRCPLTTRGCNWNGTIAEVEDHLDVCVEFVVKCRNCEIILPRSEMINHLTNSCVNREVICGYCNTCLLYKYLTGHYNVCTEYQLHCPNDCRAVLKRRQLKVHMETECPNTLVECSYRMFGCNQKMKQCELEEHYRTNEIGHLKSTALTAFNKIQQMEKKIVSSDNVIQQMKRESDIIILEMQEKIKSSENTIQQMEKKIASSDKRIEEMEQKVGFSDFEIQQIRKTNEDLKKIFDLNIPTASINELEKKVTTITRNMDKLLYPIVLRDTFKVDTVLVNNSAYKITCSWNSYRIHVVFINEDGLISVKIKMENDNTILVTTWFEGKFKLTICDTKDIKNSLVYETPVAKLQFQQLKRPSINPPRERSSQKQYTPELVIANVPTDLILDERFVTNNEVMYTLQMQIAEDY